MILKKKSILTVYSYLTAALMLIILCTGIGYGFLNYKIYRKNQEIDLNKSLNYISSIIYDGVAYIDSLATMIASNIYDQKQIDQNKIAEIIQKAYSIAEIGNKASIFTKLDFVTPEGKVIADSIHGRVKDALMSKAD